MKTQCRPLSVLLAATLALMSACAVPVTLPPPAAAPTSPPVVEALRTLVPTAGPQPTLVPAVVPATPIPPTAAPAATPKPAEPQLLIAPDQMKFEGKVDIGGRSLYLTCYGKGEPTVIMDGWLLNNGAEFLTLMPALMKTTRACFYARPNTFAGQSDPVKEMRTSKDLVADLRALLDKAGLKPPYVLAGTGFGALNLTLFASRYPKDVVGLVFFGPQAPGTTKAFLDLVPAAAAAVSIPAQKFRDSWEKFSRGIGLPVGQSDADLTVDSMLDVLASDQQVLEIKTLGDIPIYVLRPQLSFSAPDPAISRQMEQIYIERSSFFASLSSRYESREGRLQFLMFEDEAAYVGWILKLVDAARAQKVNERAAAVLKIADSYVGPLADQDKFGGVVLIAHDGKVLLNKGYGYSDRDKKTAFAPDAQFLIPLVQPWPAAAVMLLQAQSEGKFSLDDSVCKFIASCLERYKPITLRHLLANTAGLPDLRYDKDVDAALNGVWFSLSNYDVVPDAKFGKPGDKFTTGTIANGVTLKADFGNWAWTYLAGSAALNANLTGHYKDKIKNPLGLESYGLLGYENDGKLVALYDGAKPAPYSRSTHVGAALMSAADLNTFVQALFDGRLLKPDQLAEMLKPTVKVDTMPGDMYAALGAYVGMDPAGNDLVAGTEVRQGFGAYWAYYPDSKLAVIVMNNLTDWANQPYRARDIGLLLARVILAAK